MKTRLLTLLFATVAIPALAQQNVTAKNVSVKTATPTPAPPQINFENKKFQIDSLVIAADGNQYWDHASFRGKAREGKYWVECFYSKATKLNFSVCYYFKNNNVVKVFDNNTTNYYQVGNVLLTEQGTVATPALGKRFNDLIVDTFQGIQAGLFQ
jgi:hypothetical protein